MKLQERLSCLISMMKVSIKLSYNPLHLCNRSIPAGSVEMHGVQNGAAGPYVRVQVPNRSDAELKVNSHISRSLKCTHTHASDLLLLLMLLTLRRRSTSSKQ